MRRSRLPSGPSAAPVGASSGRTEAVGLATVTAPARGFARKIRAARSLVGAAQNRVIGRARLRQKHSVERAAGEDGGAVAAGGARRG
jgi:hypothetical protein